MKVTTEEAAAELEYILRAAGKTSMLEDVERDGRTVSFTLLGYRFAALVDESV